MFTTVPITSVVTVPRPRQFTLMYQR